MDLPALHANTMHGTDNPPTAAVPTGTVLTDQILGFFYGAVIVIFVFYTIFSCFSYRPTTVRNKTTNSSTSTEYDPLISFPHPDSYTSKNSKWKKEKRNCVPVLPVFGKLPYRVGQLAPAGNQLSRALVVGLFRRLGDSRNAQPYTVSESHGRDREYEWVDVETGGLVFEEMRVRARTRGVRFKGNGKVKRSVGGRERMPLVGNENGKAGGYGTHTRVLKLREEAQVNRWVLRGFVN